MKRIWMLLLMAVSCTAYAQTEIEQSKIESAIKGKQRQPDVNADLAAKGAALIFILNDGINDAQIAAFKKTFEVVVNDKAQAVQFDEDSKDDQKRLIIDFEKNKLQSIPEGDAITLRTPDKKLDILKIINKKAASGGDDADNAKPTVMNWKYFEPIDVRLQDYAIKPDFCCDTCRTCEDDVFPFNNQIVYDAVSGLTYYYPYDFKLKKSKASDPCAKHLAGSGTLCDQTCQDRLNRQRFVVRNFKRIKLKAGDPFVYVVRNVNPYLYDVELTDTGYLVNNETTPLLESLLLSAPNKSMKPQSAGGKAAKDDKDVEHYRWVKAGLIHLRAEMAELLENHRVMSRFAHNCIEVKKQRAVVAIDTILEALGKPRTQSLSSFVDLYLDASTADSSLNKSLKALYGEFWRSKYVIAYRFPDVPEFDIMTFNLKIKRKENAPYPDLLNTKNPTQIAYVRNFFKVDVSSGLYYGGIVDKEFSVRADSNLTGPTPLRGNRIVEESVGKNEFGFATYLHFYYKFGSYVNAGLNIGAGFNFSSDPKPRYFTGLSGMFGANNRLCINTGLMWGNVKELSAQYPRETDGSLKWLPQGETSIATRNKLKSGYFVSITYNLPFLKRNKGEAKVEPPAESTEPKKPAESTDPKKPDDKPAGGEGEESKSSVAPQSAGNLKVEKSVKRYRKN